MFSAFRKLHNQHNNIVRILNVSRFYATSASRDTLRIEGSQNSYKIVVPLPSKGLRVFSLPNGQIRSFIDDMKFGDSSVKDVDILDENNLRLARSMNISKLVEKDWRLRINNTTYDVQAPSQNVVGSRGFFAIQNSNQLNIQRFTDWFAEVGANQASMEYQQYLHKCQDLGLNEHQAKDLTRELCRLGVIFRYENNVELENKIFLNPLELSKTIEKALNLEIVGLPLSSRLELLEQLKAELAPLESLHKSLHDRAEKTVNIVAWSLFIFLCAQWVLFARLTWWDFSWDVIEPVTYFTTVVETILAGYVYYLAKQQEYSTTDVKNILINWRFRRLSNLSNFDTKEYEKLKQQIAKLETQV